MNNIFQRILKKKYSHLCDKSVGKQVRGVVRLVVNFYEDYSKMPSPNKIKCFKCYIMILQLQYMHVYKSKKEGKYQESIKSSNVPDQGY